MSAPLELIVDGVDGATAALMASATVATSTGSGSGRENPAAPRAYGNS